MNQETNDGKYYVLVGILVFFLFAGFYFIFDLAFGSKHLGIFSDFLNTSIDPPVSIKPVSLDTDIFAKENFGELKLSEGYKFDVNNLATTKRNPFILKTSSAEGGK